MKKNFKKILLVILTFFLFGASIEAVDIIDWSSGSSGDASGITTGGGDWDPSYVALKVNIVSKNKKLKKTAIFVNKSVGSGTLFATNQSKILAPSNYSVLWGTKKSGYTTTVTQLPDSWCTTSDCSSTINIYDWLAGNEYANLKNYILKKIETNFNYENYMDDYVVIEPMVMIGNYYGTAFELGKAFFNLNQISSPETSFAYKYSKNVFGGNANGGAKMLYNTISVTEEISDLGIKSYTAWLESSSKYGEYKSSEYPEYIRRNYCITRGRTCGRAIGVFSFKDLYDVRDYTVTVKKVFANASERTKVTISLEKWNGSSWESTGKKCTINKSKINKSTGEGSCKIKNVKKGYYRAVENLTSASWHMKCTSGCVDIEDLTLESPAKFKIKDKNKTIEITNEKYYSLTVTKKFDEQVTKKTQVKFKLQRWYGDAWHDEIYNNPNEVTKTVTVTINKNKKQGSATITGLVKGRYRLIEESTSTFKAYEWTATCESGCSDISSASPLKVSLSGKQTVVIKNTKIPTPPTPYTLTIRKVDQDGNLIKESPATFKIYKNAGCKNLVATVSTKVCSKDELNDANCGIAIQPGLTGTYYVQEYEAPNGYKKDNSCKKVTKSVNSISFENKLDGCLAAFEAEKVNGIVSMSSRIKLYSQFEDYRALLNMANTTGAAACSKYAPTVRKKTECLNSELYKGIEFNASNLSEYNETVTIENSGNPLLGFCLTSLSFENNLGRTDFSGIAGRKYVDGGTTGIATTSTLNKKCYFYIINDDYRLYDVNNRTLSSSQKYSYYVSDVKLGTNTFNVSDESLKYSKDASSDGSFSSDITKEYKLPFVYATNGTGELSYNSCENCKPLGYGLVSKLTDNVTNGVLKFSYSSEFKQFGNQSGNCTYKVTPELIKISDLQLEFRTIDTTNPFPGKSNTTRKVGSNWCDRDNCYETDNTVITEKIKDANNSYNKNNGTPKYIIELTPNDILNIRNNYNKGKTYDDYSLQCIDGEKCISNFLTDLKNKNIITINNSTKRS